MRLEAKRQQSKSAHERGVRDAPGLMEPIVGAFVESRPRHNATRERPAEESRSIHDQLDEPHSPSDRLHHCLCPSCYRRPFVRVRTARRVENRRLERPKREANSNISRHVHSRSAGPASRSNWPVVVSPERPLPAATRAPPGAPTQKHEDIDARLWITA